MIPASDEPRDSLFPDGEPAEPPGVRDPSRLLWAAGSGAAAVALMMAVGALLRRSPMALDRYFITMLHGAGPPWVRGAMIDITALGGATVLTIAVIAVAGLLLVRRLWVTAGLIVLASVSGSLVVRAIKAQFGRTRPDIVDPLIAVGGHSFPSGHSANGAIIYLTIALLATQVVRGHATRRYILAAAIALVGAIGISRVYLGVHWPSDVLAGWSFGTLWALGWWFAGAKARRRMMERGGR